MGKWESRLFPFFFHVRIHYRIKGGEKVSNKIPWGEGRRNSTDILLLFCPLSTPCSFWPNLGSRHGSRKYQKAFVLFLFSLVNSAPDCALSIIALLPPPFLFFPLVVWESRCFERTTTAGFFLFHYTCMGGRCVCISDHSYRVAPPPPPPPWWKWLSHHHAPFYGTKDGVNASTFHFFALKNEQFRFAF